jgi:hypothetical protein
MENIVILSILVIIPFSAVFYVLNNLYLKNIELNKSLLKLTNIESTLSKDFDSKISDAKKLYDGKLKKILSINPGDKVLYITSLSLKDDRGKSFIIKYEAEVVMKTELKVKLKAIDYTSDDDFGKDAVNRNSIISYMNNQWIDIFSVELIIDNSTLRDIKLDIIL